MGQLEAFVDYFPPMWLSQGVLLNQVASVVKRVAKSVVKTAAAAALTAVVATANVTLPSDTAAGWPPTIQEQQDQQAMEAFNATLARIDDKLSRFLTTGPTDLDALYLQEAQLTIDSLSSNRA